MKRARFLTATLALLGGTALGALSAQAQDPVEITFFIWAGSNQGIVPMEVIEAYKQENPHVTIDVLESNNTITYPKMAAARMTTPDDPLVHCGFFNIDSMTKGDVADMWDPIDPALVPNIENVVAKYRRPDDKGVGFQMSAIGILYNKDLVSEPPTSWTDLWSEKYRGKVTMFDYDTRMMVVASLLNGGDERNMDPGFAVWAENADNFKALVDSNDGVKNLLVTGDALIAPWFSGLAQVWINEGAPLGFAVPKEGAVAFPLFLTIVNGVDEAERKVCSDLINSLLSAENAGRYGELTIGIPLVENAVFSDAHKPNEAINPDTVVNAIVPDYSYIAEMTPEWRERWDREVKFNMR